MWKNILALCGLLLFLVGSVLAVSLLPSTLRAFSLDREETSGGVHGLPCGLALQHGTTKWSVDVQRLMSDSETQALAVLLQNPMLNCPYRVLINAPEFTLSPNDPTRAVTPATQESIKFVWILTPTKLGTFAISVTIDTINGSDTRVVGITVTNSFGFVLWQVQLFSYISTALGPILTVAWWYDKWQERKRRKDEITGKRRAARRTSHRKDKQVSDSGSRVSSESHVPPVSGKNGNGP